MLQRLYQFLLFPGVIFHEFGHELFCHLTGVQVRKVCYFRFGNPAGYVEHDRPRYFWQAFLIASGPLFSGLVLGFLSFKLALLVNNFSKMIFFGWLGVAIVSNAFPSGGDARNLWSENWTHLKRNPLFVMALPLTLIVWLISKLDSILTGLILAGIMFWLAGRM